ncbi:TauD/TfdA family dioxygenase [Phenylobacterium sp.]|uniref:TauD/TfdA family dioxygenase n=1 Tax=Phenylobacterium sp. TaxID=1871053 RepID=UPI002CA8C244|nr:TauD/TfdA family dioxygenase [Phenylobacterium sp.]HLZ76014.1 TauD/TfdA family dioxygenase [Phenylobacterium sp.]
MSAAPAVIEGPAAWRAGDLTPGEWIHELTAAEAAEIEAAARALAASGKPLAETTAHDVPLPGVGGRLREVLRSQVLDGRGFAVVRGLDPARLSRREQAAAFLGLGAHWGALRPQNAAGHVLGHVKDLGRASDDPTARLYQTHERQTYHTDSCDVVGLMCLMPAKAGGRSSLVSSVAIHNEMRARAPDLAAVLFEPIETDRRGEAAPGERPFFTIPVFNWHAGHFAGIYQRQYIESARRFDGVAPLSAAQTAALDLLDAVAEDPAFHLEIDFQPGDIQLVNNHVLFHDRTAFEDWAEPARRRHLLRLWLAPAEAQALPPVFAERFGSVTPGARGGVTVPRERWSAPLDAE